MSYQRTDWIVNWVAVGNDDKWNFNTKKASRRAFCTQAVLLAFFVFIRLS
ncbi:hypothetical protein [Brevibacillus dissolubilis]|nr:hypothetical protein [Brevibacillus dissolubilis]